jgi:hypothetical protein
MLGLWGVQRQAPVDGVIAIDTVAMKGLLEVVGPVEVPSFGETFTAASLLDRLIYYVEVKHGGGKDVLVAFAEQLEKRVLAAGPGDLAKSAAVFATAADTKHIQMYFTDAKDEAIADALGWSGRVSPPQGTTDVLAVCNVMVRGAKINMAMKKTIGYAVALLPDHSAATTLTLDYANTGTFPLPLTNVFGNWLRVYRSTDTVFPRTTRRGLDTITVDDFGFPAEGRSFEIARGDSRTEILTAWLPKAVASDVASGGAASGAARYRLYMVRQNDLEDIPTTVELTLPPGWSVTGATARYIATGAPLPVTVTSDGVRMAFPLRGDLELEVRLMTAG